MFVPVLIDLTHYDTVQWGFFYDKSAHFSYSHGWPLIASECYTKVNHEFLDFWNYEVLDQYKKESLWQYIFPSETYDALVEQEGSRLEMSLSIQKERCEPLESFLENCILDIMEKQEEPIEAFIVLEATVKSLEYLSAKYKIPIICVVRGALHSDTYRSTGFMCFSNYFNSTSECKRRYDQFLSEMPEDTHWLDNRELLSLFLEDKYIHYLRLFGMLSEYPATILCSFSQFTPRLVYSMYDELEVIKEVSEIYNDKYMVRLYPCDRYGATYNVPHTQIDRSKPSFLSIINSERVITTGSNMAFEAMLWGRDACCRTNLFPMNFMCKRSYEPEDYTPVPLSFLNFFCFSYLIPFELILDPEYIRWRLTNPSEMEIYERHMKIYLSEKNITPEMVKMPSGDRVKAFLSARGFDGGIADPIGRLRPQSGIPLSFINDASGNCYSCINRSGGNNKVVSLFEFANRRPTGKVYFDAVPDSNYSAKFISVKINGGSIAFSAVEVEDRTCVSFNLGNTKVYSIQIIWTMHCNTNSTADNYAQQQLNAILNSTSWRMTAPLRKMVDRIRANGKQ